MHLDWDSNMESAVYLTEGIPFQNNVAHVNDVFCYSSVHFTDRTCLT
jgi:hypothetical protein